MPLTRERLSFQKEEQAVEQMAARRLSSRMKGPAGAIRVSFHEGCLFLHGRVARFYDKQLAQETVKSLDGVLQVVNEIEVGGRSEHVA